MTAAWALLLSGLVLYPLIARHGRTQAAWALFAAVAAQAAAIAFLNDKEGYDKMDFFPWNEARIVRKRNRDSTVIDCGWSLDHPKDDGNIFSLDDPVVREHTTG